MIVTPDKSYSNYSVSFPEAFNSVYFATAQIVGANLPNGSATSSNDVNAFSTPFFATVITTGITFLKIRAYDYLILAIGS